MLILFLILNCYQQETDTAGTTRNQLRVYLNDPLSDYRIFHTISPLFPKIEVRKLISFGRTENPSNDIPTEESSDKGWLESLRDNLEENFSLEKKVGEVLKEHNLRLEFDPAVSVIPEKQKLMTENFERLYGQVSPITFCLYLGFSEFKLSAEFLEAVARVGVPVNLVLRCDDCVFVLESLGESREISEVVLSFLGEQMTFVSVIRYWLKEALEFLSE